MSATSVMENALLGWRRLRRSRGWQAWLPVVVLFGCSGFAAPRARAQGDIRQLYEQAQAARAGGDLARSEELYLEVIHQSPQFAIAHHNLGIVYFLERKYRAAADELEKAVKLDPRLAEAQVMLGLAYYHLYEPARNAGRSEEHTSELQSLAYLVCRLLLEKKKKRYRENHRLL